MKQHNFFIFYILLIQNHMTTTSCCNMPNINNAWQTFTVNICAYIRDIDTRIERDLNNLFEIDQEQKHDLAKKDAVQWRNMVASKRKRFDPCEIEEKKKK